MKRKVTFLAVVLFTGAVLAINLNAADKKVLLEKAEEKIVKLGVNNVAVQKVLYTKDGAEVIVDEASFGLRRTQDDLAKAEAELLYWQTVDPVAEQAKVQVKIDKLNSILAKFSEKIADPNALTK